MSAFLWVEVFFFSPEFPWNEATYPFSGSTFLFNVSQFSFGSKLVFILVEINFLFTGGCFSLEWKPVNLWVEITSNLKENQSSFDCNTCFSFEWKLLSPWVKVIYSLNGSHFSFEPTPFSLWLEATFPLFASHFRGVKTTFALTRLNGSQSWCQAIAS